ncbi:MAG: aminofutalosine synthase MqnE [Bacteroidia bacterium]|nr:aminofutalosine synthase MqnE [Bacteroidia bacterium]MDW8236455.1 aminofutalosine synthase MqnE [Bacteroidia bacterium]
MQKPSFLTAQEIVIWDKVEAGEPLTDEEALFLYHSRNLGLLGILATIVRERLHGKIAYYNRNFHIEPTNICIYECAFCSFARKPGEPGGWEYTPDEIESIAASYVGKGVTEVHIVGGVHPKRGIEYYADIIRRIKRILPGIHVKAFTAVELKVMCARSRMSYREGLSALKEAGLDSLPGGGAEIFHPEIRQQICATKASTEEWLEIHRTAHELGIPSNATMLYGHIEKYEHRIHHMRLLRELQAQTGGFNCFIPLKYRKENNALSYVGEVSIIEDLKNYAVSRLYLHNIPHLKAYWPMIGRHTAQISLSFGVDDLDGTIDDTTKIYSMAGAEEQHPVMTTQELEELIRSAGYVPQERDSLYRPIHTATVS